MNCSTPGSSVLHHLLEPAQIHDHVPLYHAHVSFYTECQSCLCARSLRRVRLFAPRGLWPPGSSVRGTCQARTRVGCRFLLQGTSGPRGWACISCTGRRFFTPGATTGYVCQSEGSKLAAKHSKHFTFSKLCRLPPSPDLCLCDSNALSWLELSREKLRQASFPQQRQQTLIFSKPLWEETGWWYQNLATYRKRNRFLQANFLQGS